MDKKPGIFWPAKTRSIVFPKTTMLRGIILNVWNQMNFILRRYVHIITPNLKSLYIYLLHFRSNKNIRQCARAMCQALLVTLIIMSMFGRPCGKVFDTFVLYRPTSHSYPLLLYYRIEVNDVKGIWLEVVPLFMRICCKFIAWTETLKRIWHLERIFIDVLHDLGNFLV